MYISDEMWKGLADKAKRKEIYENIRSGKVDYQMDYLEEALGIADFTHALKNTATNYLMKGVDGVVPYWQLVCDKPFRKVKDFKEITVTQVNGIGLLEKRKEFEKGSYTKTNDGSETYQVDVYNRFLGLSMQAMANDQLGVLRKMFTSFGQAFVETMNDFVWGTTGLLGGTGVTMADGYAVFNAANHANYQASGFPLNFENLQTSKLAMKKQTNLGGNKTKLVAKHLFVAADLELIGTQLVQSDVVLIHREISAGASVQQGGNVNPHKGKLQLHVIDDLPDGEWILSADPVTRPVVEVGFLRGWEKPKVDVQQKGDPNEFYGNSRDSRCQTVFGGTVLNYRTLQKNKA